MDNGCVTALAEAALGHWDLPSGATVAPIRLTNNAVFEVTSEDIGGARFALRVHRSRFRSRAEIESELSYLVGLADHLADSELRLPSPVRGRDGSLVVDVRVDHDGQVIERTCDLLAWVDGAPLREEDGLAPRHAGQLGRALGLIHDYSERRGPTGLDLPIWDGGAMFGESSPFRPGDLRRYLSESQWRSFAEVARRTSDLFEKLGRGTGDFGVIHFDFILGNCHFAPAGDGHDLGVIDFDDNGFGHYLYDLAPMLDNLSDSADYSALRAAFLDGYRSVRTLTDESESHLPLLMAARHANVCLWAAGQAGHNEHAPDAAGHIEWRIDRIERSLRMQ